MKRLLWDLVNLGAHHPSGISRCAVALAQRTYHLPSLYLLHPRHAGGPLEAALRSCPGEVRICPDHPRRLLPWRWTWERVLGCDGVLLAPGNHHLPTALPAVILVHDLIPYDEADYARFRAYPPHRYAAILRRAARLLAVSDWTAGRLDARFPGHAPCQRLDQGLFPEPVSARPVWAPEGPFDLFVGGAEPRKRAEDAAVLARALGGAALVAVGAPWGGRTLEQLCGPAALVRREATDAELAWLYRHCRCLLYPTVHEGFGLPALECLRAGRPVVARSVSCLPEVLGGHAIWHPFDGSGTEAVRAALAAWRPASGLAAHLARFDWEAARDRLAAVLAEVDR